MNHHLTIKSDLFIGGEWRPGQSGDRFDVVDPADGTVVAQFAIATEGDCLDAVAAADAAASDWAATAPRERGEILRTAFEILTTERDQLAEVIVRENGKSWGDAIAEAGYATEFFRWFAEEAVRIPGDYRTSPGGDKNIIVTRRPIGVSLLITPWNFPAAMATRKLAPALAAGCTAILKPASETPLTAAYIVEALRRSGLPAGVVNLVTPVPTGPAVRAMLDHGAIRKLSFTGSTEVGRVLLANAAGSIISSSMELGGNAPLLVLPGADLEEAVSGALAAKMRNGGSACTSANRLYVHRSLHDEFVERFRSALDSFAIGSGLDRGNDIGALVSLKERDKVAALVDTAVAEGATISLGGETPVGAGAFYPPTLLTGVTHGSTITRTEIFGPVATVIEYDEVDEAIRMANDTEFGLIAYVFGPEGDAMRSAARIDAGMVGINRGVISDPAAPFGGVKQSGLGREGGTDGILEYLEEKYIATSR
ncbi:NAD-dependent succinate-semialdehyde dehydrogenase [Galbitalea soli]|uniref:NAD-dependent succinate-semialdehyde dehydrogenase n=1 Tax=Galbitalea soli TaxID=1268042 RepID=A0A7C9PMV0_9MICO|nr:NAD-dependent succinate-semialdehyde dehydrogenase [Galbitalea soli]NEM91066.1 NAD-dependent succinate-semialdehyde dehydrogenase [Galbitalea soli]NYJ29754.1 succinate-semialdehyde dehydrogenase/glutarate-semialdehyde dehydrogenase [Galbitalea soli]